MATTENKKENLKLWHEVEKTNPKYTKAAKVGGINITAIAPQFQIMNVTEQFGVYGKTWGFRDINLDFSLADKFNLVVFKGTFFFPEGSFEIINSAKLYMDRALTMVDDNFAKKIETDALTKAISKLGFNADIFMGKFDDVRYVEEMNKEFAEDNKTTAPPANTPPQPTAAQQEILDVIKAIEAITNYDVLKNHWATVKPEHQKLAAVQAATNKRKAELAPKA